MKSGGVSLPKVLIIGYGSPLRGDDNIGCHVAQMLEHHYHDDSDVRVIGSHQLTPEMAEDVAASEFVLFLDAAAGTPPGKIQQKAVKPQPGPLSFAHFLDPSLLLAATMELYGSAPRAELLTIVGAAFELGDALSPAVVRRLPEMFERAHAIVESHRHPEAKELVH
jgi:hydrogenase maturation protease